jgi:hypothetical protein
MSTFPEEGSASVDIAASPQSVWGLVSDITRMGEWSPECVRAEWLGGATGPTTGALFQGYNQAGDVEWDVTCRVMECEPGAVFAFKAAHEWEHGTGWRFELAATGDGTTLTESFDAPSINVEGAPANFDGRYEILTEGVATTLARIKEAAESA